MASHAEIKVGSTDWVIRIGGVDTPVKVLEKIKKASGRGWEFRCKRFQDGRSVGRDLIRGSGALRKAGEPVRSTGFAKKAPAAAAAPRARAGSRHGRSKAKPSALEPPPAYAYNPPASAFFSGVQEPGNSRPPAVSPSSGGKLGSLRGRGRPTPPRPVAPARTSPLSKTPSAAKREIEKLLKQADLPPLVAHMIKGLLGSDGSDFSISRIYGNVMSEYRLGIGPFRAAHRR